MQLTRDHLYLFLFFALPLVYFQSLPIATSDLAIWIAMGRASLEHSSLLRHDVFSFLPTGELVYPAGICLIYGTLYGLGGLIAVSLFHKAALFGLLAMLYRASLAKLRAPWPLFNIALVLYVFLGLASFAVDRPALIALIPFLASYLLLQKEDELSLRELCALGAVQIAWVNLHGSWPLLAGMFGWRIAARAITAHRVFRSECWGLVGALAASLLNPFGYRVFPYVLETALVSRRREIDEWMPTNLHDYFPQGILFYVLVAAVVLLLIRTWRSDRAEALRILRTPYLPLLALGALSFRNTVFPFLAFLPWLQQLGRLREDARSAKAGPANLGIVVAVILAWVAFLPWVKPGLRNELPPTKRDLYAATAPWRIANYLKTAAPGRVFSDWEIGGFLALAQNDPIFMDTRNIIFSDAEFNDYSTLILAQPGWQELLRKYDVSYIALDKRAGFALIGALASQPEWALVIEEPGALLYRR
ncbi:MAG: hypothetical protein P4M08_08550 [Oligoflexia bacterium]|nr:hypothetical protein [Oligoflexia bacterium]